MAVKRKGKKKAVDFTLLISVILLVFIGIIMVFSSSWPEAMVDFKDGYHFLRRQLLAGILGFIAMIILMNFDYRYLKKLAPLIYIGSIILGLLVFTPLGQEYLGARRWINLGFTTIMPSDFIKLGSIIFFAAFLSNKKIKFQPCYKEPYQP